MVNINKTPPNTALDIVEKPVYNRSINKRAFGGSKLRNGNLAFENSF